MEAVEVLGHEVRNLLATFVGFSELLLSNDWPADQQREYLLTMREEGLRVTQFLNDLLDLERLEGGSTGVKPRPTEIDRLLAYVGMLSAHDPHHPVTIESADELPQAMAEPDRIQQVLANLLSNARKYSPAGGPIRITARVVRQRLEVSVQDSGVGIPAEALPHVFDKFYRVDSPSHRGIKGIGIGLSISKRIVEAHGGRIWVESAGPGCGACFTFNLPLAGVKNFTAKRQPTSAGWVHTESGRSPSDDPGSPIPASTRSGTGRRSPRRGRTGRVQRAPDQLVEPRLVSADGR